MNTISLNQQLASQLLMWAEWIFSSGQGCRCLKEDLVQFGGFFSITGLSSPIWQNAWQQSPSQSKQRLTHITYGEQDSFASLFLYIVVFTTFC